MANIFDEILKAITYSADPMLNSQPTAVDNAVSKIAARRNQYRTSTRRNLGITDDTVDFWKGFSGQDKSAKERYITSNPLAEEKLKKQYPNLDEEQLSIIRDNSIRRNFMKNSKHPAVQELYNQMFDSKGNLTAFGQQNWSHVTDMMAQLAMDNDLDGLSDEKENRANEKWYNRWGKAYLDTFDNYTTMRESA